MMIVLQDVWHRVERRYQEMQMHNIQTRHRQEDAGYRPGMFSGRKKTGSLEAQKATCDEVKQWKQTTDGMNRKDFIREVKAEERNSSAAMSRDEIMKGIREEERKRRAQFATEPIDLADVKTMCMPLVQMPQSEPILQMPEQEIEQFVEESQALHSQKIEVVQPQLPQDNLGRYYLCANNPYEDTHVLAEALVKRYRELNNGRYPAEIVLSALRFLTTGTSSYSVDDIDIPYVNDPKSYRDGVLHYDLMARSEKLFVL